MQENKKMVFVITSMGRGGAERVVSILGNYYVNNGWRVTIVMLWHNIIGYELDEKIEIVNLSEYNKNNKKNAPVITYQLTKYLKKETPDVVVSFIAENSVFAGVACKLAKTRHITSERVDPGAVKRNPLIQKLINYSFKRCDCVVFQTERAKKYYSENIQKRSAVIGNPIQISKDAEDCKNKIVCVGRLEKQKNHTMLIKSFSHILQSHPEYVLEIYGDGALKNELQELIESLKLENKVFLKGNVKNVHQEICDAKLFVLPSDFEGLSNALLEAMMMGLACISTDCAGSDEVIENRKNGILVPVGNEKKLTEAIEELITNDTLRHEIAANAKESTARFKTENIISQWTRVIEGDRL